MSSVDKARPVGVGWYVAAVAAALGFLCVAGLRTLSGADFWEHLATGRVVAERGIPHADLLSFTSEGQSWVAGCWLYDRWLYGLWNLGGAPLVTLAHVAAVVAAFALLLPVARRFSRPPAVAFALLLCAWVLAPVFEAGPGTLALFFVALFLWMLSAPRRPWALFAVLVPAEALWVNMHGSAWLGPTLAAFGTAAAYLEHRATVPLDDAPARPGIMAGLTAALLAAAFLNPYGAGLFRFLLGGDETAAAAARNLVSPLTALFAPGLTRPLIIATLFLGAGGLVARKQRMPLVPTATAIFAGFLVVRSVAHLAVFALAIFPFLSLSLDALGESANATLRRQFRYGTLSPAPALGLAVLLAALSAFFFAGGAYYRHSGSLARPGLGVVESFFPARAVPILARSDFPPRCLNMPTDGAYLAWALPARPVFSDTRPGVYGPEFRQLIERFFSGDAAAIAPVCSRWKADAVLLNCVLPGAATTGRHLLDSGEWALAYFDGTSAILIRRAAGRTDLTSDRALQDRGLEILQAEYDRYARELSRGRRPGVSARLVGAGFLFAALDRQVAAADAWRLLWRGAPDMSGALLQLGIAEARSGQVADAIPSLEQFTRCAPRNPQGWYWLSACYSRMKRTNEAAAATAKMQSLAP